MSCNKEFYEMNYTKEYYEDGESLGLSCYKNYRWMPDLTIPMCQAIIAGLSIDKDNNICDFGCAKGYLVKAFHELGYHKTCGIDISQYAIENCDYSVKSYVFHDTGYHSLRLGSIVGYDLDWIICKDVLEHISYEELDNTLEQFLESSKNVFIVVPLGSNGKYFVEEYEKDVTHIIREDLQWWKKQIENAGFIVEYFDYQFPGVKENWAHCKNGNGFFIAKR